MAAKDLQPVKTCPACARTMVAKHSWNTGNRRGAQTYWHDAKTGLCRACSQRAARQAARTEPKPRQPRTTLGTRPETESLLDDYDMIRDSVSHIREAAKRLGISYSRLDKMLYRARQRGDARGRPPLEQYERALDRGAPYGRTHRHQQIKEAA